MAVIGSASFKRSATPPKAELPPEINQMELWITYVNPWIKRPRPVRRSHAVEVASRIFRSPQKSAPGIPPSDVSAFRASTSFARASGDRLGKTVSPVEGYPFAAEQARLKLDGRPSIGPADAPVTVAVFSDFQCGFCREEAKILRSNLLSAYPDKVRMVFLDFPLTQIHDWSQQAAVAGRCVAAQSAEKFWLYHDWVFDEQPAISKMNFNGKFLEWSGKNGLDSLQLGRCQQDPGINAAITASFQDALNLGLTSTPTMFVNGRQIGGKLEWQALKQVIDTELEYVAAAKKKEECCSVTLPGIFKQ